MTNGDKLKEVFPNLVTQQGDDFITLDIYKGEFPIMTGCAKLEWWDAEYKGGDQNE